MRALAARIRSDYRGRPPVLLGVLRGSFMFLSDLARRMPAGVHCDFVGASSYGNGMRPAGPVRLGAKPLLPLGGRPVVVVDAVVDTGRTLQAVLRFVRASRPESVRVCALLKKPGRIRVDYVGFRIPRRFVVGYGLDRAGLHRSLPYVAVVDP